MNLKEMEEALANAKPATFDATKSLTAPTVNARDAVLIQAVMSAVAPVVHALEQRIEELERRPTLKYLGTWREGRTFSAGSFVTDRGGIWYCNAATTSRPGENADWSLAVKSGGVPTSSPRSDATAIANERKNGHLSNPRFR
jgi:hypothetical protein